MMLWVDPKSRYIDLSSQINRNQGVERDMFKRRPKTNTVFQHGDSFSESALSSDDDDTSTLDTSYFSGGSASNAMSNWTEGTDGGTNAATYWTGSGGSTIGRQASSPCFGNGFFRGPCPRQAQTKNSVTETAPAAGCMNFIWDSSSDEGEQAVKMLKTPSLTGSKLATSNILAVEARDESSTDLQNAFAFVSNDRPRDPSVTAASSKTVPKSSVADTNVPQENDSSLLNLLVTTGSNLLGLDESDSSDSSDGSRLRRVTREARRSADQNTKTKIALKEESAPRTFKAPWNRPRRRQDEPKHERRENVEPSEQAGQPKTKCCTRNPFSDPLELTGKPQTKRCTSNPFSGRLSRQKNNSSTSKKINPPNATKTIVAASPVRPLKLVRQPETDKRLNDAIMVFEADGASLLGTLPRVQSSRFIPSKELQQQMERDIDRHNFDFDDATIPDTSYQPLLPVSEQNKSKSQSKAKRPGLESGIGQRTSNLLPLERQELKRATNRSGKSSSNRSMSNKSNGNRSHATSKSRHTRSSRRTRATSRTTSRATSRKSETRTPTNQLSFSDDEGNDFFSVGSLDA